MKKVFLVIQEKELPFALDSLADMGTFHVENQQVSQDENLFELKDKKQRIEKVLEKLSPLEDRSYQVPVDDSRQRAAEVFEQINLISQIEQHMYERKRSISRWEEWGNFDPQDIRGLAEKGIYCYLVEVPKEKYRALEKEGGIWIKVVSCKNKVYKLVIFSQEKRDFSFETLKLPAHGLDEMRRLQKRDQEKIRHAEIKIREYRRYFHYFENIRKEIEEQIAFMEIYAGRTAQESLSVLKGFCPVDAVDSLKKVAKKEKWGLLISDPDEKDVVPTLIRNPKWVEVIKPVFKMINVLPGYKEMDISVVFLLFFSIFFGMLIGDAGYGLVFLIGTGFFHRKQKENGKKEVFFLMYVLSFCAIVWGVLTGVFFGQQWLSGHVTPLMPWLNDIQNVQMLCFLIGAIHLSIAHIWRAVLKAPSLSFLAEMGWMSLVWGMFFLARVLILGESFPTPGKLLFWIGFPCVVLFTKPNKNIFKAIGPGVGDLLLNIINTFTDVVSYIRLFAVGLASIAVADAFNDIALGIGFSNIFAGLISAVILVIGHLFNIALGAMAILVHGLRLNVLEFSNHMSMEWSGFKYNPFKRIKSVNQS